MINLLPTEERKHVRKEYKRRRLIVIQMVILIFLGFSIVELFPMYTHSRLTFEDAKKLIDSSGFTDEQTIQDVESSLKDIREKTKNVTLSENRILLTNIVSRLLTIKAGNVAITNFLFNERQDSTDTLTHVLTIEGVASTRDALLSFSNAIKKESFVRQVDLPVSNFAKEQNLDFAIVITLQEKDEEN